MVTTTASSKERPRGTGSRELNAWVCTTSRAVWTAGPCACAAAHPMAPAAAATAAITTGLQLHRLPQLFAEQPAQQLPQGFSTRFQNKAPGLLRPVQLEAGRQCRNPDLAGGPVEAQDKAVRLAVLELKFEYIVAAFHIEAEPVAQRQQRLPQLFQSSFCAAPEFPFVHRLPLIRAAVVPAARAARPRQSAQKSSSRCAPAGR